MPLLHRKRNPDVAIASQEEAGLILKLKRIPGSRASIQKDPDFPNHYTTDKPVSPALTQLEHQGLTQNTKGSVTAEWQFEKKSQTTMSTRQEA